MFSTELAIQDNKFFMSKECSQNTDARYVVLWCIAVIGKFLVIDVGYRLGTPWKSLWQLYGSIFSIQVFEKVFVAYLSFTIKTVATAEKTSDTNAEILYVIRTWGK